MDRAEVKRYFTPFPKAAGYLTSIGGLLAVIGKISNNLAILFPGIILAAAGGILILIHKKGEVSDGTFDDIISDDLKELEKKAIIKNGVNKSDLISEAVVITGLKFGDVAGAEFHFKKGDDNILRFTPMVVTIVNFTQHQLIAYNCVFDLLTGATLNESTDEYFYKDVVSVSTKTESRTVNIKSIGKIQLNSLETFTLTTSGGTSLSVYLSDPRLAAKLGGGEFSKSRAEKAIQVIRNVLREKKI